MNFQKIFKNYFHFIALILLVFISVLSTNYYQKYKKNQSLYLWNLADNIYLKKTLNSISENINSRYHNITINVEDGDTFENILKSLNLPKKEERKILKLSGKYKTLKKIS